MDRIGTRSSPQGSVLRPLLFNIYLNDLFHPAESTEVCNFADVTTFFDCDKDLKTLISSLEHDSHLAIEWFESNCMKLNQDKCHLLVSGCKQENIWARIGEVKIWESSKQKLLRVVIDRDLSFNECVSSVSVKKLAETIRFIKIITSNEFSTKKTFNEIACRSPVWIFSINLNISW